jgi:DNA-binding XRE family transcriptional regulator/phage-related protein
VTSAAERELLDLPADLQAHFLHVAGMLEEAGPQNVGMPLVRPLEQKLWEMRLRGKDGIARAIWFAVARRRLVVVRILIKTVRPTPEAGDPAGAEEDGGDQAMSTKPLRVLRAELLGNPEVRRAYHDLAPEYEIARAIIRARSAAGLSQAELAERMGTAQSYVARLESGRVLPSTRTFLKVAEATGTQARFELVTP